MTIVIPNSSPIDSDSLRLPLDIRFLDYDKQLLFSWSWFEPVAPITSTSLLGNLRYIQIYLTQPNVNIEINGYIESLDSVPFTLSIQSDHHCDYSVSSNSPVEIDLSTPFPFEQAVNMGVLHHSDAAPNLRLWITESESSKHGEIRTRGSMVQFRRFTKISLDLVHPFINMRREL
jgi:hypothetical protein